MTETPFARIQTDRHVPITTPAAWEGGEPCGPAWERLTGRPWSGADVLDLTQTDECDVWTCRSGWRLRLDADTLRFSIHPPEVQ